MHDHEIRLGLDIGRVLISPDPTDARADTSFIGGSLEAALATPPYPGMFDVVPRLVARFGGRAWLVSKARPRVQEKTRQWLDHHEFFERTGICRGNLRFCLERHEKATHCAELGITHFVDDRLDVLEHLDGVVGRRYLFGPQKPGTVTPSDVTRLADWAEALRIIA